MSPLEKSPDAFRTISEAADELDLPQHVLRFWETRFAHIKPLKRGGGRRYYRPQDVLLLKGIRHLLYDEGFTIKGVQKILKDQGVRHVMALGAGENGAEAILLAAGADMPEGLDEANGDGASPLALPPDIASIDLPEEDDAGEDDDDRPLFPLAALKKPKAAGKPVAKAGLSPKDRERLNGVLKELLDLKRLLDRAREG